MTLLGLFLSLFLLFSPGTSSGEEPLKQLRCVIHLHSDWSYLSQGYSLENLATWGEAKGEEALIFTDHALVRASYGLFPFRRVLHHTEDKTSVFKRGIAEYFSEIHELQKQHPPILLIPAVEVSPFYYWTGNFFRGTLTLRDWHRHLLVLGIDDPKTLKKMPLASNPHHHPIAFLGKRLIFFGPSVACFFLFWYLRRQRVFGGRGSRWMEGGILLFAVFFFIESIPMGDPFDPYHGDQGAAPYQRVIDYVNANGGLIFWAHPEIEAASSVTLKGIRMTTEPYETLVTSTYDYAGFAALGRGKGLIQRGGLWDQMLKEYCDGVRKSPVWVISETDTLGAPELFRQKETVVLVKERSKQEVLRSLRQGKMYAVWNTREVNHELVSLDFFTVKNEEGKEAGMGEEISSQGKIQIIWRFKVSSPTYIPSVTLIRSGEALKTFAVKDGEEISFEDQVETKTARKIYYRLEIEEPPLLTNPIFVLVVPSKEILEDR